MSCTCSSCNANPCGCGLITPIVGPVVNDAWRGYRVNSDFTIPNNGTDFVDVLAVVPPVMVPVTPLTNLNITLPTMPRVGQRVRVVAVRGDALVTGGAFPLSAGTGAIDTVAQGSFTDYEFTSLCVWNIGAGAGVGAIGILAIAISTTTPQTITITAAELLNPAVPGARFLGLSFTGGVAGPGLARIVFPKPATDAASYTIFVENPSLDTLTLANDPTTGVTATLAASGTLTQYIVRPTGVTLA